MPQELLIPSGGDLYRDAPAHTVATKQYWGDNWPEQANLYCNSLRWGSGPVRPQASLSWRYGEGMRADEAAFGNVEKLDLLGRYVKIRIEQEEGEDPLLWYGLITDDARRRDGAADQVDALWKTGRQTLGCEGLDLLLMRSFVDSAWVRTTGGGEKQIQRGLTFNDPNTFDDVGNRSFSEIGQSYVFAGDLYDAKWWSTLEILKYLLAWHSPADARGKQILSFELSDNAKAILPTWDRPVVKSHGRTLRSLINELCTRQRMLTWTLTVASENPSATIELDVCPFNAAPIALPSGKTQEANRNQVQLGSDGLEMDRAVDADARLRDTDHARVEQVVVRGARKRVVVSLSYQDSTLEADWTATHETAYETGPDLTGVTDVDDKERRINEYRTQGELERVFSWFRLPADWDGKVGDGTGSYSSTFAIDDEANPQTAEPYYVAEMRFLRHLPKELSEETSTGSPKTVGPPLAVIKTEDDRYLSVDRLAVDAAIEGHGHGAGRGWSASLKVQDHAPGVILKVSGGMHKPAFAHFLAGDDFTPITGIDEDDDLDWKDLIVTVMFEIDSYVEQRWPANDQLDPAGDAARVVYVDIGDRGRLDWVHRLAVIGVDEGDLQYRGGSSPASEDEAVRDDREAMLDLAKFVFQWYGVKREAFSLQLKQLFSGVSVGDLITEIGANETAETVNALITGVEMDLVAGTTRITTGHGELDAGSYFWE